MAIVVVHDQAAHAQGRCRLSRHTERYERGELVTERFLNEMVAHEER